MSRILNIILEFTKNHPLIQSILFLAIYNIIGLSLLSSSDTFLPLLRIISPLIMYGVMLLGLIRESLIVHQYNTHKVIKYIAYSVYILNSLIIAFNIANNLKDIFNI